jgi:uncharacterized protein YkwD
MSPIPARLLVAVGALLCAVLALPAIAPARTTHEVAAKKRVPSVRAADEGCANTDVAPGPGNLDVVRAAILCLNNQERTERGLPPLKENAKLRDAAAGHSHDMVENRYFDHDSPAGSSMVDRILRAGYVRRNQGWSLGENIAWGTGQLATAAEIHKAWMNSAGHRANMLRRSFREIGIGITLGNPSVSPASAGATYTADFGVRR